VDRSQEQRQNLDRQSKNYESQLTALDRSEASGRHWTEKKLEEMTSRDWRIFKEDHNITTKGGGIPNPLRDWEEAKLPSV
jgi:ATP-dependent RNA helicase DDX23/PRP28